MQFGDFELTTISGGTLRLDGGAMFGVVPRPVWERARPADEQNRVPLATNCLLVRGKGAVMLVDTGYGTKATAKERELFALEAGQPLVENLAAAGVQPEEVDHVVMTHLHFDHAGGLTYRDGGGALAPTFPRARHWIQLREFEDATDDLPELAGSYFKEDFLPLYEAGLVELVAGDAENLPGVLLRLTGGHTRGHQIVEIAGAGETAVYLGDICPTASHLRTMWTMSYDQFLLDVRRQKMRLLSQAVDERRLVLFDHDPEVAAAHLRYDDRGNVVVDQTVDL